MAVTPATFVDALRTAGLLEPEQAGQLAALQKQFPDLKAFARELLRRGWLTPYQANQLLQERGQNLILGSYILLERLGEGGMGQVFKARHKNLDRIVALKLIHKDRLDSPQAVKRFRHEIRAAAALNHPNIVLAFDADQSGSTHFLTMEYVEGTDLAQRVKEKGPLPVAEACDYIRQAALGLQHALEKGLVHRDIKPANLLLAKSGTVKILDMGLARVSRPVGDDESSSTLTKDGAVMGTLDYIAPEQAMDSHTVDIRADLYSLGCTFYYLLTGKVPFPGGDAMAKLMKHQMQAPPPVEQRRPDVPPPVAAVVRKLMAKNPDERFQTPAELAAVLAQGAVVPLARPVSAGSTTQANSATPPKAEPRLEAETIAYVPAPVGRIANPSYEPRSARRRVLAVLLAAVVVLIGGSLLTWRLLSSPTRSEVAAAGTSRAPVADSVPQVPSRLTRPETRPAPPATLPKDPPKKDPDPPPPGDTLEVDLPGDVKLKLVRIPAGTFTMGSPKTETQRGPDEDQHEVEITRPFYAGVYTVTQEQYEAVMKTNPSNFKKVQGLDTKRFPVESVIWKEAKDFCDKLSELPDEKRAGRKYRLPTEAEWEYICRGGAKVYSPFHYGNSLSSEQANFNGDFPYGGAAKGPYLQRTTTVGSYKPNAFGLYDMHGNVYQWCEDWYGPYDLNTRKDPTGPANGQSRVLRGGSWYSVGWVCRAAYRGRNDPGNRINNYGFRVLCVSP